MTDAESKLLKDAMKAKDRADKATQDLAQANERLAAFEGLDPVKIRALLDAQAEAERAELEKKGEYSRLVAQMGERHTTEITAKQAEIEAEKAEKSVLKGQIAEMTVGSKFESDVFIDELTYSRRKVRQLYGSHFEYVDGAVVGYDKPAGEKDRTVLVDSTGKPLVFGVALKQLVDADPDKDTMYKSKAKPGSQSTPNGRAARNNPEPKKERDSIQKIADGLRAAGLAKK